MTFLHFSIDTGAHAGLVLAAGVVIRKPKGLCVSTERTEADHLMLEKCVKCSITESSAITHSQTFQGVFLHSDSELSTDPPYHYCSVD